MVEYTEINQLIMETIDEYSTDILVKKFIRNALRYELDIWNRHIRKSEIEDQYHAMVEKSIKEKQ